MAGAAGWWTIAAAVALLSMPLAPLRSQPADSTQPAERAKPAENAKPSGNQGQIIDEQTLRREYEAYRTSLDGMRLYHVRYIRVATEDKARDLIARIRSGAPFEDLASRHSTHPESAAKGGDLGTHAGCRWAKATLEMLDSLKRGQTWPKPVKGTHGWGIYRLESVADIEPRPFSQYRSELLSGSFEPECPWVPPVTVAPAGKGDAGKENAGKGNAVGSGIERR